MWLILIPFLLLLLYIGLKRNCTYWKDKRTKYVEPWPIIGNMAPFVFQKCTLNRFLEDIYYSFPNEKFIGMYQFIKPVLFIRDLDLIKQVLVKDFSFFSDHNKPLPDLDDPLWTKNLALLTGESWHQIRTILSPSFTGSKMRLMFGLMKACLKQFDNVYTNTTETLTMDMTDLFSRFTNDIIATTTFGLECDSFKHPDNEFYVKGKGVTGFRGTKGLVIFLSDILPPALMKLLNLKIFNKAESKYYRDIMDKTLSFRKEKGLVRVDMIHLLLESQKENFAQDKSRSKIELTVDEMTAQALVFFLAGFHTSSTLMSFVAYELALNPDIQERLADEIMETLHECNGDVTYHALFQMKFLDMVISETLRKWPPISVTLRQCVKNYTIEKDDLSLEIDSDVIAWIPIYPIHRDPKYYPNPEKFDPERFSDENKHNIKPYSFLPFGEGPRNCIGTRFALFETKLILFHILSKFTIIPVEKTEMPLVLSKAGFGLGAKNGVWLGLEPKSIYISK